MQTRGTDMQTTTNGLVQKHSDPKDRFWEGEKGGVLWG